MDYCNDCWNSVWYLFHATASDMDQTHFSAWCIVSAPLILGFDLTNNDTCLGYYY